MCAGDQSFPFKAVIFDMDGVLIDSEAYYIEEQARFQRAIGIPVNRAESIAQVGHSHQEFMERVRLWWEAAGVTGLTGEEAERKYEEWAATQPPRSFSTMLFPGAVETVLALKEQGVHVALASSSSLSTIQNVLGQIGLEGAFEQIVSGADFEESKPNPAVYLHSVEKLALDASECCCVEDSVPGITAGKRAGLYVVARREDRFGFTQELADKIIDTLPELLSLEL